MAFRQKQNGSGKQQRPPIIGFRATDEERAQIERSAERVGLTVGSYVRSCALKKPKTRAVRRPPVEMAELAKLLGLLGAVGGTILEIAKKQSAAGGAISEELATAVTDFRHAAESIIQTMGKHPHLLHVTHHDAVHREAGHHDH